MLHKKQAHIPCQCENPQGLGLLKCDPLSQNEHKVATAAIQNYYRFKFFMLQALK